MKSIQFAVLFALFATSTVATEDEQEQEQQQQQQQPLKERWSISRPKVVYENNDLKTLALRYDISDFPQPENVQFQLMRGEDCEVPLGHDNDYLQAELVFEEAPNSDSSGTRSVTMTFQVLDDDQTNSPLFSTPEDEGKTPLLQFCNRLSLHTTKGMMVNWLDARVTVYLPKEEEPQQQQQQPVVLTISSSAVQSSAVQSSAVQSSAVQSQRMLRSSR
jgi:hypothetical protein